MHKSLLAKATLAFAMSVVYSSAMADVVLLENHARGKSSAVKVGDKPNRQSVVLGPNSVNTGEVNLTDQSGVEFFINTDITFSTSSSASGAASEASYTGPVNATTLSGATVSSTLNDAFDGYGSLCVSLDGATGPCTTGGVPGRAPNGVGTVTMYNDNGAGTLECSGRQVALNAQTIGGLSVSRKVFVPTNDSFVRWMNVFTNTTGAPITLNAITSNNLGSDANTALVSSSSGDAVVTPADTWATTFQSFSGTTSSDPRLGHVFYGAGAPVAVSSTTFVNGDDNPFWVYNLTIPAGATRSIVTFATAQPSRALAASKASDLAGFPPNAQQCMTVTEISQVANFGAALAGNQGPVPVINLKGLLVLLSGVGVMAWLALRNRA